MWLRRPIAPKSLLYLTNLVVFYNLFDCFRDVLGHFLSHFHSLFDDFFGGIGHFFGRIRNTVCCFLYCLGRFFGNVSHIVSHLGSLFTAACRDNESKQQYR